jgi:DNA-binding NarL/FixJ family response regulator
MARKPSHAISIVIAAREHLRDRIRDPLTSAGIHIAAESSNLAEALALVARQRPQLCLLDRELPGADITTIAALSTPRPHPQVVVVGGDSDPVGVRADRLAGAARSLPGAIEPDALAAALMELASEAAAQ